MSESEAPPLAQTAASPPVILHVLCVAFHHRNGPQVEFAYPPFPDQEHKRSQTTGTIDAAKPAIELPEEWSFMPFMCLPDGAHFSEEEFIYFHLPPVPAWTAYPQTTLFGLACYRQVDATTLVNKTADVTRSMVQKAVVILATQPVLGSVRSKLGLVTQAFFAQKDFSKLEILETLYQNLTSSIKAYPSDHTLYMGMSLRETIHKFKHKLLILLKLLILEKRVEELILFFGPKVERLSTYQYALVSLVPELTRRLEDVGSPTLDFVPSPGVPTDVSETLSDSEKQTKERLSKMGFPLQVFGEGSFFQPYIPLQQIDVLISKDTKSFVVGTTNAIFTHHKACAIDVMVDTASVEAINPGMAPLLNLTAPDKKFMDDIIKSVAGTWNSDDDLSLNTHQIEYEGSDEEIRARFETYLSALLLSQKNSLETADLQPEHGVRKVDYMSEFGTFFVKAWYNTQNYKKWEARTHVFPESMTPGHPCHGYTVLGAAQTQLAAKMSELGKNMFSPSDKGGNKDDKSGNKEEKGLQHKGSTIFASMNSYMKKWSGAKAVPTDDFEGADGEDSDKKGSQEDFEAVSLND